MPSDLTGVTSVLQAPDSFDLSLTIPTGGHFAMSDQVSSDAAGAHGSAAAVLGWEQIQPGSHMK